MRYLSLLTSNVILFLVLALVGLPSLHAEDNLPELPREISFGVVREVTMWEDDPSFDDQLLDFETARLIHLKDAQITGPHSVRYRNFQKWAVQNGFDAYCEVKQSFAGLLGISMAAIPVAESDWDPSYGTLEQLKQTDLEWPCSIAASRRLPATWIFRTRESYGVL